MLGPTRKPWIKPEVRQFDIEELLAAYRVGMPEAEYHELVRLAEQLQRSTGRHSGEPRVLKSAKG